MCRTAPRGSLASRRTGFIALILPTLTNANFAAVAHGLTEALRQVDYHLLIGYTDYSLGEEDRQLTNLLARPSRGHRADRLRAPPGGPRGCC